MHTETLAQLSIQGFQDPSTNVSSAALAATAALISALAEEPEVMQFSRVITPMFQIMQNCVVKNENEKVVVDGLEVIQECLGMEKSLVKEHIPVSKIQLQLKLHIDFC